MRGTDRLNVNKIAARIALLPAAEGGLLTPMKSPTPSLVLIFESEPGNRESNVQVGVLIRRRDATELHPGDRAEVDLEFWSEIERSLAAPRAGFKIWYAGRVVGEGEVLDSSSADEL